MPISLKDVSLTVQGVPCIYNTNLTVSEGKINILLGATLSGKTSLMRLLAGLDKPTSGHIYDNDVDVTNVRVQDRNVAMVYQSFINYPSLTVYENIASPLKLMNISGDELDSRVKEVASLVHLTPYLQRIPLELSGGQQQRCALARALVKQSGLVLLDEPLANLDYKLREELRSEMHNIFAKSKAIFVYATTEPEEALMLGGNTATLHNGRITQYGATQEIYHKPNCKNTASVFSNPPMNTIKMQKNYDGVFLGDIKISSTNAKMFKDVANGEYELGFRANYLSDKRKNENDVEFDKVLDVAELTGSTTFLHVSQGNNDWVALLDGTRNIPLHSKISLFLDLKHAYVFSKEGELVQSAHYVNEIKNVGTK